jgi:hypothetical protein
MKNFLIGLGLGLLGILGAIVFGVLGAIGQAVQEGTPVWLSCLFGLSLFLLFAGPLYFWLVSPLSRRLRRAR